MKFWNTRIASWFAVAVAMALVVAACGGGSEGVDTTTGDATTVPTETTEPAEGTTTPPTETTEPDAEPVSLVMQLTWVPQSQFAGYIMASEKGFYAEENLDVEVVPGGSNMNPVQQVVTGAADLTLGKAASIFVARAQGVPLVAVAQFHQGSGFPLVAFKESGIEEPEDIEGKTVAAFMGGGDEVEVLALAQQIGLEPGEDFELVEQGFTLDPFLNGEFDAITPTRWNELQTLYEQGITDDELTIIDFDDYGVGSPHGILQTTEEILAEKHDAIAAFVRATIRGWEYAFANPEETVEVVLEQAVEASEEHQMNMLLALEPIHFPEGFSAESYGSINVETFERLSRDLESFGLIESSVPADEAYDASVWESATGS